MGDALTKSVTFAISSQHSRCGLRAGVGYNVVRMRGADVRTWNIARALWVLAILTGVVLILLSCRPERTHTAAGGEDSELIVAAAISLKEALTEIGRRYTERTGIPIRFAFGASGVLQRQLEEGAPFDVFVGAAPFLMDQLQARQVIRPETRRPCARNRLVLIASAAADVSSLADVVRLREVRVALGNPKTVPAGFYARQMLERRGLWQTLQQRLILAENSRQVLDYVRRGEVEAGLCFASDIRPETNGLRVLERFSERDHDPILYEIAVTTRSPRPEAARQFIEQVVSPQGQRLLQKHGFLPADRGEVP